MTAEMLTVKVHPDDADEERLLESLGAKQVVFFHATRKNCETVIEKLAERGIDARCLAEGQSVTVIPSSDNVLRSCINFFLPLSTAWARLIRS